MQRLGTVTSLDVSAVAGHHAMPAALLFNTVSLILMHFFTFSHFKVFYFAPTASASSNVKPDVSQTEVTFHNDVGFATVYSWIYCRNFLALSNQMS